jgi:hypothetical protein
MKEGAVMAVRVTLSEDINRLSNLSFMTVVPFCSTPQYVQGQYCPHKRKDIDHGS